MIISHATVIWRKRNTPVISIHRYLVNKGYWNIFIIEFYFSFAFCINKLIFLSPLFENNCFFTNIIAKIPQKSGLSIPLLTFGNKIILENLLDAENFNVEFSVVLKILLVMYSLN